VKKEKKLFNEIRRLKEFEKEFQKLLKKFKTLEDDLETFINTQLNLYHKQKIDNLGVFRIPNLAIDNPKIYKARKFTCKSIKGTGVKSGIRIIYAYYEEEDIIEFIEIYYKGEKANEDRDRIVRHYKKKP
jgi:mRNA-degrading endonuclease YafQ of YafQ-DinJ toxin-antitoxin module